MLVGVELCNVDIHEADVRILERRLGSGREICVASTDTEDKVCFPRKDIGSGRASDSDGAQRLRMIVTEGSLPSLGLSNGNPRPCGKARQSLCGPGINDAATRDNQWLAAGTDSLPSLSQSFSVGTRPWNFPNALREKFLWILEGFNLNILGKCKGHSPGLGLRRQDAHSLSQRR